jgi:Protein of unknown function (DUF1812).
MKDDLDGCVDPRGNTRILVKFNPDMYELPENEHQIDSVHVYVFDENDKFVTAWNGGCYDYLSGEEYEVFVNLDEGIYQFIAWTNPCDSYRFSHAFSDCQPQVTTLQQLELYLSSTTDKCYRSEIPDLHHGIYRRAAIVPNQNNLYIIYLIPDTYRINVTVKGLDVTTDSYEFNIRDNNSHYSFENAVVSGKDDIQHIRNSRFNGNQIDASMRILPLTNYHRLPSSWIQDQTRLANDRSPQFSFTNTTADEVHYSEDLVKMIRTAYENGGQAVDFTKTYEFDIVLTFDVNMNVTITVNGWSYHYNPTEL